MFTISLDVLLPGEVLFQLCFHEDPLEELVRATHCFLLPFSGELHALFVVGHLSLIVLSSLPLLLHLLAHFHVQTLRAVPLIETFHFA